MKRVFIVSATVAATALGACSTDSVRPQVAEFASSVAAANSEAQSKISDATLEARIAVLRRNLMAENGRIYIPDGNCLPIPPNADTLDDPPSVADNCDLKVGSFGGGDLSEIELPSEDPLVRAYNARRLMRGLDAYAAALSELVNSKDLVNTASAASNALKALDEFFQFDAANRPNSGPSPRIVRPEGRDLVETATTQALETYRYRVLKRTVNEADEKVREAALVIARWQFEDHDEDSIAEAYENLIETALTAEEGDPDAILATEQAYDAVVRAEQQAGWSVYHKISRAHRAMRDSLNSGSLDALFEANTRIAELQDAVRAFRQQ